MGWSGANCQRRELPQTEERVVRPLTKMTRDGKPYRRVEEIETLLEQLVTVSLDELLERSSISNRNDPRYIPSECLVHLIRGTRSDPSIRRF